MLRVSVIAIILSLNAIISDSASTSEDRITNGNFVPIQQVPYQVSILNYDFHVCGGSLISSKCILTAAHCLEKVKHVEALSVRLSSSEWASGGIVKKIVKMISHPEYDEATTANDIAILLMESPVVESNSLKIIKLASSETKDNTPCIVSGWGNTFSGAGVMSPKLKETTVKYLSRKTCEKTKHGATLHETMICGEGTSGNDSCQGDSGGPLVNLSTMELVGVVSWGYGCGDDGLPGVYCNVFKLRPWILETCKKL